MSERYMGNDNVYKRLSVKNGVVMAHPRKGRARPFARADSGGGISPITWDIFLCKRLERINELSDKASVLV